MTTKKRSLIQHFLNTTPSATAATYGLISEGVTDATMNHNPQTTTETYIGDDIATTTLDSYQPVMPFTAKVAPGDTVYDFIYTLRRGNATYGTPSNGGDDLTDLVEVDKTQTPDTAGTSYPAIKYNGQIQFDSGPGGAGGGRAEIGYTFNVQGAAVLGTFNTSTLAFTAS